MASSNFVEIVLALRNVRQFVSGADQASKGVTGIGKAAEKSGKQAHVGWTGIAKWAGGAAAVYGASRFVKGAVQDYEALGKSTIALTRTTGLDTKTASEWATVLKARNVDTNMFQRGLVAFSRQIEKTRVGTKKHNSALEQLGFHSKDTAIQTGNVNDLLLRTTDRFSKMTDPAKRAALAQSLFGRSAIQLAPLLFKGSKAIREQLGLADKYGATLTGKNTKAIGKEIEHQRELQIAYSGVKIQLGQALLPVMLTLTQLLVKLAELVQPLTRNALALKIAIVFLTAAFVAYKIALAIATIMQAGFNVAMLITIGWVALIIVALIALGIGIYLLIKHWSTVKRVTLQTWDAIKAAVMRGVDWIKAKLGSVLAWARAHWPLIVGLLTGPFGLAIAEIVHHWDAIQAGARRAVNIVLGLFQRLVAYIKAIPSKIGSPFSHALHGVTGLTSHIPFTHQYGGVQAHAGAALVGEAGPELLHLPAGARVTPRSFTAGGLVGVGGGEQTIVVPLYIDGREVGRAVARATSNKLARR